MPTNRRIKKLKLGKIMSNRHKTKPKRSVTIDIADRVVQTLKSSEYDYRTAEGIASMLKVQVQPVENVLKSDSRVRVSVMKSNNGKNLYTLKDRKSALGDYISAVRALSSEKFGG